MECFITAILLSVLLSCNGDVSESRNYRLPLRSFETIPSPLQSLLPPTFENPIKDYTVGLVPPKLETPSQTTATEQHIQHRHVQTPVQNANIHYTNRFLNPIVQFRSGVQQRGGNSVGSVRTVHRHFTNHVQPQVYQPKTVVYQQYQQPNTHHHHNQEQKINAYRTAFVGSPLGQKLSPHSVAVTQNAVYQNSAHVYHGSSPVQRLTNVVQHVRPSLQQSAFVSRPVSSSGVKIIQAYPSNAYEVTVTQHASTLDFGSAKLEPELLSIINDVLGRHNF